MKNDLFVTIVIDSIFKLFIITIKKKNSKCINQWDFKELHVMSAKMIFSCYGPSIYNLQKWNIIHWSEIFKEGLGALTCLLCLYLSSPILGFLIGFPLLASFYLKFLFFLFFPPLSSNIQNPTCLLVSISLLEFWTKCIFWDRYKYLWEKRTISILIKFSLIPA